MFSKVRMMLKTRGLLEESFDRGRPRRDLSNGLPLDLLRARLKGRPSRTLVRVVSHRVLTVLHLSLYFRGEEVYLPVEDLLLGGGLLLALHDASLDRLEVGRVAALCRAEKSLLLRGDEMRFRDFLHGGLNAESRLAMVERVMNSKKEKYLFRNDSVRGRRRGRILRARPFVGRNSTERGRNRPRTSFSSTKTVENHHNGRVGRQNQRPGRPRAPSQGGEEDAADAVKALLSLKADFVALVTKEVSTQGDLVRSLKANKDSDPQRVEDAVQRLLDLKARLPQEPSKKKKKKAPSAEQTNPSGQPSKSALKKAAKAAKKAEAKASKQGGNNNSNNVDAKNAPTPSSVAPRRRIAPIVARMVGHDQTTFGGDRLTISSTGQVVQGDKTIAKFLCRISPNCGLYENRATWDAREVAEIDSVLDDCVCRSPEELEAWLAKRTFLAADRLSLADIYAFSGLDESTSTPNVGRWRKLMKSTLSKFTGKTPEQEAEANFKGSVKPLEDAKVGKVVTRFPPEPSGFLHIGHVRRYF